MASFTPQEIEQFLQEFFDVTGARQYVGARYVPIFGRAGSDTVEWDDTAPYEPLTVVMHEGVSFVSRRYVPRGIQVDDTDYWVETYRFNAQVEQYRQEVLSFQGQIDGIRSDYVPFPDPDHHPKYGAVGQVLSTLADGTTKWEDPVVPSDEQAEQVITQWLDDHPEATTTVEDGAITPAKLATDAVTTPKIENGAVTTPKIDDDAVTNSKIIDDTISDSKLIQDGGVLDAVTQIKHEAVPTIMGESTYPVLDFEIGTIAMSSTGLTYTDNPRRARTPEGLGFHVSVGDVVGMSDYSDARYYLAIETEPGYYRIKAWQTADYIVEFDGTCYVLLAHINEVTLPDVNSLASLFFFRNNSTLEDGLANVTDRLDQMGSDSYTGFSHLTYAEIPLELGDFTLINDVFDYVVSASSLRTKEGTSVPLRAGDTVGLTDYSNAKFSVWILDGSTWHNYGFRTSDLVLGYSGDCYIRIRHLNDSTMIEDYLDYERLLFVDKASSDDGPTQRATYAYDIYPTRGVSHRGVQYQAPENTMAAFKLSAQNGFHFIETDVQMTSDNVPVLIHDTTVDRTTDGTGNVADMTYSQIRALDAGSWFGSQFAGERVPSLEEFLVFCRQTGIFPYLELKSEATYTQAQVDIIVGLVQKYAYADCVTWLSWSTPYLQMVINADRTMRVGRARNVDITDAGVNDLAALQTGFNRAYWSFSINPSDIQLTEAGINKAIAAGQGIEMGVVSTEADMLTILNALPNAGYINGCLSNGVVNYETVVRARAIS